MALVGAVLVGTAACGSSASSGSSSTSTSTGSQSTGQATSGSAVPVSQASTSSRGVTNGSINVVFPVVSLNSLAGKEGFASDPEFGEQTQAINFYVKQINDAGGINGRKIDPIIATFDPTNESDMRALCKTWTEGSPAAFAVLDGIGDWTGDNQLCITQEGQTPFIGQWTTTTNWTKEGSPYLWWTGPDQAAILQAVVNWGLSSHRLGGTNKVGIIAGDRASDQTALNDYLLPDLRNAGITAVVKTIASDPSDTATTDTQAPLVVQQLRSAGITSVIPLIPFNVFYPVLQAETTQQYFPKLLLSDYEESINAALGLIPVPYEQALDGQEGLTTETLGGGTNDSNYTGPLGYDPGGARPAGSRGTRPTRRCRRAARPTTSSSRGPSSAGARRSPSLPRRRGRPGPTSTGAPSSPPCPRSPTSRARSLPSSATARTSATARPSTRS